MLLCACFLIQKSTTECAQLGITQVHVCFKHNLPKKVRQHIVTVCVFSPLVCWCPGGDVGGSEEKPEVKSLLTLMYLIDIIIIANL